MRTATKATETAQKASKAQEAVLSNHRKYLTATIASKTLIVCYASKSWFIRAEYDRAGNLKQKKYYRYWNETSNYPFSLIMTKNF